MKYSPTPIVLTLEFGGHEVLVHGKAFPEVSESGAFGGPPENYDPGSPAYFEPDKITLTVPVTDDLSARHNTRLVHLDITQMLEDLGADIQQEIDDAFFLYEPESD